LAANDEDTLKMLLNKKLFAKFQEIIRQRQNDGITAETDLIRIEDMKIEQAEVSPKGLAHIVVRFVSEQVNLLKNAAGEVIEGDENFVQKITDVWTFERNLNLKSPAWLLASTRKNEE
jgi:predicted lipid-binding transport protein (Tim44 family)